MNNKDPRGVRRGSCSKCSCEAYQLEEGSTRAACSYCECPAPAHEVLPEIVETHDTVSFNSSASSDLETPIIINVPSGSDLVNQLLTQSASTSTSQEPSTDEIETLFPKKFPQKVTKALETKSLKANHKTTMVQKVVDNLFGNDAASNKCLQKAAKRMAQRWSPLKVMGDPESKGLYDKMRRRRDRLNETGKRRSTESSTTDGEQVTPQQAKEKLKELWISGERNVASFRAHMAKCRDLRKDESKRLPGLQLMRAYPCLAVTDLILEEFEFEMGLKLDAMERNWTKSVTSLMTYMSQKKICIQTGSLDEKTLCILEHFHLIPLWYKKNLVDNKAARVLEVFESSTPIAEMMPRAKDPPRLLVHGRDPDSSISCYLDTEPLFSIEGPFKGLLLLLAAYFVMNIKFPPHTRLQLIVLCVCTVGATAAKLNVEIAKNNKLIDLLKELSLM